MRIETDRLILRDFEPQDWREVQEYAGDSEAVRYRPFGPCTEEETRLHVLGLAEQKLTRNRRLYDLAIVLAENNRLVGGCDTGLLENNPSEAAIGFGLNRAVWGNGYAIERDPSQTHNAR